MPICSADDNRERDIIAAHQYISFCAIFSLSVGLESEDSKAKGDSIFLPSADCHSHATPYSTKPHRHSSTKKPAFAHFGNLSWRGERPSPSNFSLGIAFHWIPVRRMWTTVEKYNSLGYFDFFPPLGLRLVYIVLSLSRRRWEPEDQLTPR